MKKRKIEFNQNYPLTQFRDDEVRFREKVVHFTEDQIKPLVEKMDKEYMLDNDLIHKLFENGFMNIEIPNQYSGSGGTFFQTVIAIEEIAKVDPSVAVFIDVQNSLINNLIMRYGNDEQKGRLLPLLSKESVGAFSISEKEAGSDAYALSCKADEVEGGYLLTGEKHWTTNAKEARFFIIFALVNSESSKGAITAFLVDKNESMGLSIGEPLKKLGIRASSTCNLLLDNVFVPAKYIIGGLGRGKRIALEVLTDGRLGIAAQMVGLAQGAFQAAVSYAKTRKQFGNYIGTYQGVNFPLAEMATKIEAAKLLLYNAARIKMTGGNFGDLFSAASMAKLFTANVAETVTSLAMDIYGGNGYIKGNSIEKFYRDAKIGKIYEGTNNMQLRSIARKILRVHIQDN